MHLLGTVNCTVGYPAYWDNRFLARLDCLRWRWHGKQMGGGEGRMRNPKNNVNVQCRWIHLKRWQIMQIMYQPRTRRGQGPKGNVFRVLQSMCYHCRSLCTTLETGGFSCGSCRGRHMGRNWNITTTTIGVSMCTMCVGRTGKKLLLNIMKKKITTEKVKHAYDFLPAHAARFRFEKEKFGQTKTCNRRYCSRESFPNEIAFSYEANLRRKWFRWRVYRGQRQTDTHTIPYSTRNTRRHAIPKKRTE